MNITNAPSGTIRSALRYPDFRWLLSALAVSQIGDWLYNLALVVLVYDRTPLRAVGGRHHDRPGRAGRGARPPTLHRSQPWRTRYPLARVGC